MLQVILSITISRLPVFKTSKMAIRGAFMEIRKEIIEDNKELSQEQKDDLAKKIAGWFDTWDDDRSSQITDAKEIMSEVYLNQPKKDFGKDFKWKSDYKMNTMYNIKRAQKSVLWREMWSNPSQMFAARGTDEETEKNAKKQKAAIDDSLNKMDVGKQYDLGMDNIYDIGEIIFKVDWIKKTKVVKRQDKSLGFVFRNIIAKTTGIGTMEVPFKDVEIPYYENARVQSISPIMFVYDHAKWKIRDNDSWDSIIKIYKRFDTLENIKQNKLYTLTDEQIEQLKTDKDTASEENKDLIDIRDKNEYANEVSILFAHGDFKINGKLYKNYVAEVVAGKFLVRFEENPMYINPFILCALEFDPATKRGISPLKSCMGMAKAEEKLINVACDVQKLTANPPCWISDDLLDEENTDKDGNIPLAPGKYVKYKNDFNGSMPTTMSFSGQGLSDLIGLFSKRLADISSTSNVMYGNIESSKRTATELSLADKGSSSQASKILDTIHQDLTIPMVKKVAELLAMFKDGVEYVYAEEKGKRIEYKITNAIRQAQYDYIYEDRNAILERKAKFNELYQMAQGTAQNEQLFNMLDWHEILTTGFEMIGFDNTDKFFVPQTQIHQIMSEVEKLPQPVQDQLAPVFAQVTQGAMQQLQIQQMQAQGQMPQQEQLPQDMTPDEMAMQEQGGIG